MHQWSTGKLSAVVIAINMVARWQPIPVVASCFDAKALSRAGAMGLMQLMPATARELGVVDAHNPIQNLQGGTRYLDSMNRRFADMNLALAAYNAGPGTVERFGGIPPYPETTRYIEPILSGISLQKISRSARTMVRLTLDFHLSPMATFTLATPNPFA